MSEVIKIAVALGFLFTFFLWLLCTAPATVARRLKLHEESRLWIRLIGVCGIVWVGLVLATDPRVKAVKWSRPVPATLERARYCFGGAVLALFLAVYTKGFERGRGGK